MTEELTKRELEVIGMIARGMPISKISKGLGVSASSIKHSVVMIRLKLADGAPTIREIPMRYREKMGEDPLDL